MDLPCAGPAGGVGHVLPPGGTSDHLVGHCVDSVNQFIVINVKLHLLFIIFLSFSVFICIQLLYFLYLLCIFCLLY